MLLSKALNFSVLVLFDTGGFGGYTGFDMGETLVL